MYLQNPPDSIARHISELTTVDCEIKRQEYKALDLRKLKRIKKDFPNTILGQEHAERQIIGTLYDVAKKRYNKPCVMLFYGSTGVGKTETAKYIADVLNVGGHIGSSTQSEIEYAKVTRKTVRFLEEKR